MKITQEVREYAKNQGVSVDEAQNKGMAEKSAEFKSKVSSVCGGWCIQLGGKVPARLKTVIEPPQGLHCAQARRAVGLP